MHLILHILGIAVLLVSVATQVSAQAMQSSSYRIQNDSVNVGGLYGSSASYRLEDTAGEIATGESSSTNYALKAGYQQMQETYLALTAAADVTMSPSLGGVVGGESDGSTSVTATTDNIAGYQLTLTASSSPAMQSGTDTISDYVPGGASPDFTFSTDSTESHLAFSPEGSAVSDRYRDNGIACGVDTGETALACWDGLSTTPRVIAESTTGNHPNGTATSIRFKVGIGSGAGQVEGVYTATTTLTLLPL